MTTVSTAARRALAVGLALAACLTSSPVLATAAEAPAQDSAGAGLDRYYRQHLGWGSCIKGPDDTTGRDLDQAGVQCADVTVPLDYAAPRGARSPWRSPGSRPPTPATALARSSSTTAVPGGPALQSPPQARASMKEVGARYDIVGFDPRFIGRSTALDCGLPVGMTWLSAGAGRAGFDRQVALQKSLADKCRATDAAVLPHITTRNTARDMDVIRGTLGERKISFLGYSYGTYLGTVYTQMFPGRHDRMVLDGAINPSDYRPRLLKGTERENEKALSDWAAWAAGHHDTYGLGRSRAEVLAAVDRIVAAAARGPLTIGAGADAFRIDDSQVPLLLFSGIADDTDPARASFGELLSVLAKAAEGRPTTVPPMLVPELRYVLRGEGEPTGAQSAVICGDVAAARDPELYWRDIERTRTAHPLFGALTNNINPCAFWDTPREEPTRVRHDAPALIVAATGDPRTTYKGSVELHEQLPSSRLVTLQGANRHALFGRYGNACVDDHVNRYLATGKLPVRDRTCVKQAG
ncbi:alpha/beta hydrolase [Streptomyces goshikiensis]